MGHNETVVIAGMSETEKIIYTALATLVGAVILLIITEFVKLLYVSPILRFDEMKQLAVSRVNYHSNLLTNYFPSNPNEEQRIIISAIKKDLRDAATELRSRYDTIRFRSFFSWIRVVPSSHALTQACDSLIYLHNSILYEGRRDYIVNEIEINHNRIYVVIAALTGDNIPERVSPEEREKPSIR